MTNEVDDVEDLRRRLVESERRERLYSLVFEHAPDPAVVVDDLGRVVVENRAAHEFFGAESELRTLVTKPLGGWALRQIELAPFREELLATGRVSVELSLRGEGGAMRHVTIEAKTHAPDRHVLVLRDVTERRHDEAELRHARRVDSLGYLTAGVAHDLNNLLTPMLLFSGLLADEVDPASRAAKLVSELKDVAERSAQLLKKVLAVVRSEPKTSEPIDLNAVVNGMKPLLAILLGDRIELVLALDETLGPADVPRDEIEQALLNLAANGRDAMPEGGRLTIQTLGVNQGAATLGADADLCAAHVALVVTDTGVGMSPETQARMFDGGFTTKEPGRGTGLGLSTLQRFVERSGSLITVRSELGCGTSVALYLRREPTRVPLPSTLDGTVRAPGVETILLVETDDAVRRAARAVLETAGHVVLEATGLIDALAVANAHDGALHLVVTERSLPGTTGQALVRRVREGHPAVGALYTTAATDDGVPASGTEERGVTLRKPFSAVELRESVRAALDYEEGHAESA